jgi:hypothetical protein
MNSNTKKCTFWVQKWIEFREKFSLKKILNFFKNEALSLVISFESKLITSYARRWGGR